MLVAGKEMPGGRKFLAIVHDNSAAVGGANALGDVSLSNDSGQHVFRASLDGGGRGLYRLDLDGAITPILKNGDTTDLGKITFTAGRFPALNNRGQIAVVMHFGSGPETIVVLTPSAP